MSTVHGYALRGVRAPGSHHQLLLFSDDLVQSHKYPRTADGTACFRCPHQLFSVVGHCGQLSCAALSPILPVTTRDSIQAESVTMLLCSVGSIDDNEIGADQPFLFCLAQL